MSENTRMDDSFAGRVVNLRLGGRNLASSQKMLSHMLDHTDGVLAYFIDPDHQTLTAYLDDVNGDDFALVRALVTAGMYPRITEEEPGFSDKDSTHAC